MPACSVIVVPMLLCMCTLVLSTLLILLHVAVLLSLAGWMDGWLDGWLAGWLAPSSFSRYSYVQWDII